MDRPRGPCSDKSDVASDTAAGLSKGLSTLWQQVRVPSGEPDEKPRTIRGSDVNAKPRPVTGRGFRRKCGRSKAYGESDAPRPRSRFEVIAFGLRPQPTGLRSNPERNRLKLSDSLINMGRAVNNFAL